MIFINSFQHNKPFYSAVQRSSVDCGNVAYDSAKNILYYVTGNAVNTQVSFLDMNTMQVLGTFPHTVNRVRGIIYNPADNQLYVNFLVPGEFGYSTHIYDCNTLALVNTIPMTIYDARFRGLATPEYTYIPYGGISGGQSTTGGFVKISTSTGAVTMVNHGGGWGQTCAWDSNRNRLWIPLTGNYYNYLKIYDLNTNTTFYNSADDGTYNPPFYGFSSITNSYDPVNDVMYMMEEYGGIIYKLNAATGARITSGSLGSEARTYGTFNFNSDYSELYITCVNEIQAWDTATMTKKYSILNTIPSIYSSVMVRKDSVKFLTNGNGIYELVVN